MAHLRSVAEAPVGVESDWVITGDRNLQSVEYALILKSSAAGALRIRCTFR